MDFAAVAPPPPPAAPSAYIAQAQQRYMQDATLRQSRNINIVGGGSPSSAGAGSDRRLIRQGSVDKARAVYEANTPPSTANHGGGYQSLDRRARKQASHELDSYRSLDRPKQQQQQMRVFLFFIIRSLPFNR